jgi:PrtD family type I secretion system ABC transporter
VSNSARSAQPPTPVARENRPAEVLRQCRSAFVFAFVLTAVVEALSVVPILYTINLYDRVLASRSEITLVSLTVLVFGSYLFWSGLEWIRQRLLVRISLRIDWDLAADTFDMSFRRHAGRRQVNVHQVLGDLIQVRQFLSGSPLLALMSAPFAIMFIAFGALFHPWLAIFSLCAALVLLGATWMTQRVSAPLLKQANNASAEASRVATQGLRQAETALALDMQGALRRRWHQRHQDYLGLQVSASESAGVFGGISGFLTKSLPSMQMALGIWLAIQGLITGGMVIAATFLVSKSIAPIQKVLGSWHEIVSARQSYERLSKLFSEDEGNCERMSLPAPTGHLSVCALVLQPDNAAHPVLCEVNFSIEPGHVLAIVGPSASGKSSLVKSLVGIWRPAQGSVRLDSADLADWARNGLGKYIGYVPQDIDFFEGSVAENIARLGQPDPEMVVKAAIRAGIHEIILTLPQAYDTMLGENGHSLTGGQRQRLALARALYGDPCYVVMDEPNASLDEAGERCLVQAIRALKAAQATVIFTTHRPELIHAADHLLVLAGGKQVGFGNVSDMLTAARKLREARPAAAPAGNQATGAAA